MIVAEDMAGLHAAAFSEARPWSAAEFNRLLTSPHCFAVGDSRAFALVRIIADEAELLTIATHPDLQRQGLGRAVMEDWIQFAAEKCAHRAFLEVAADNAPAIALYRVCGFRECGIRKGYYRRHDTAPVDAVLMALDLTSSGRQRPS